MKLNKAQMKYWFKQFEIQRADEKKNKEKKFIVEIINGQKIKKMKPIVFLHMIIKDYLDLSYWNWKYIKENEDIYNNNKEKLVD
tara:strand:+ start:3351 stop:3602 length:252 start_codon:yes stop_codon:yes gene_type:complete